MERLISMIILEKEMSGNF